MRHRKKQPEQQRELVSILDLRTAFLGPGRRIRRTDAYRCEAGAGFRAQTR